MSDGPEGAEAERTPAGGPAAKRAKGSRRTAKPLKRALAILGFFLVVNYLILPQITGVRKSFGLLRDANLWVILLGGVVEAVAIVCYAQLTRTVLPRGSRIGLWRTLQIDLSTLAVSHLVPGGAAAGTGLGFRLLSEAGVSATDTGFALAMQGIGSAVVLNLILWIALVISIPLHGFNPLYGTAAVIGVVLIGSFFLLVVGLTRGEARAARVFRAIAKRVPFLDEEAVHRTVHRVAARLRALIADRSVLVRTIAWASANWVFDAASLWLCIAAFGHRTDVIGLLISYGLANVLAAIPLTPGGLGVVEATLSATLVGFGVPAGVAVLGVVVWRLFSFWLPIPVGGVAYVSLIAGRHVRPAEGESAAATEQLRRIGEQTIGDAESARAWAARHGMGSKDRDRRPKEG